MGTFQCPEHKSSVLNHFEKGKRAQRNVNAWQRISILDSYRIHLPVINAESLETIFFVTSTTGEDHGLLDFLTMSRCNKSSTCLSISTRFAGAVRRGCCLVDLVFPVSMWCFVRFVLPRSCSDRANLDGREHDLRARKFPGPFPAFPSPFNAC